MADVTVDALPHRPGHGMRLYGGGEFFPEDPQPEDVDIVDIAHGLSNIARYNGQGRFLSVAQHSVLMTRYTRSLLGAPKVQMAVLLHDAAETYSGDQHKGIKSALGGRFRVIEDGIQEVIYRKYSVYEIAYLCSKHIKHLDRGIIPAEKNYVFREKNPLGLPDLKVRYWPRWWTRWMFMREFRRLRKLIGGEHG